MYYLVGTTGFPNYGDELIAAAWLSHLAEIAPDREVWLDCPSPGPAAVLLGGLHPRVRFTDTFWRLCWEAPSDDGWEAAHWVRQAMRNPPMAVRFAPGIELAGTAEVVHLIGGGYITGVWPRHYGLLAAAAGAVERSGGRAVMTGQGLWPAPAHVDRLLPRLAEAFYLVDVRDDPSARLLGSATAVSSTCDDIFLSLGPHLYREPAEPLREVMLCLQSDLLAMPRPALAAFVSDTLRAWDVPPERVGLVEGIPGADRVVFDLIEPEFPGVRFYPFAGVWRHGLPAGPGQTWISTRFHPHLLAAAAGATGVAVTINEDYYPVKHTSLVDLGTGWTVSDATTIPVRPSTTGLAPKITHALTQAKNALAARIYTG